MSDQSTYTILLVAVYAASVAACGALFLVDAPYGRYARGGWGPAIQARWAWLVMEMPAVFVIILIYLMAPGNRLVATVLLFAWELHYVYRTFIYTALLRGARKRFPIALVLLAILFNTANGYINGWSLVFRHGGYTEAWLLDIRFILGMALFVFGFLLHVTSDTILRRLRMPDDTGYRIPLGGFFRFVSSPNYLGEILQWTGWALATWSPAGLAFAVFTVANLAPRAVAHHRWYRETFSDYPEDRKALIPFLL